MAVGGRRNAWSLGRSLPSLCAAHPPGEVGSIPSHDLAGWFGAPERFASRLQVTPPDEAALDERKRSRASSARASAIMDSSGDGDGGCTLWYTERSAAEAAVAARRRRRMVVVAAMSRELIS